MRAAKRLSKSASCFLDTNDIRVGRNTWKYLTISLEVPSKEKPANAGFFANRTQVITHLGNIK